MQADGPILVTGGAGFIGSHLCERLLGKGAEVVCLDAFHDFYDPAMKEANVAPLLASPHFHLVRGDVTDREIVTATLEHHRISQVVHLAARAGVRASLDDPRAYEKANVGGTLVLLEALRHHPVESLVFGSSSSVYGASLRPPFREDDHTERPLSPYAASKRAGEHFCHVYARLFQLPVICLRFFTVYGPRNRPDMAAFRFAASILRGEDVPLYGDGSASRDFTYVGDTVSAIESALDWAGDFEVVNVGNNHPVTLSRFVSLIQEKAGVPARVVKLPPQPGDVPVTCADVTRAERILGFQARVSLEDGVGELVSWIRGFIER